MDTFYLVDDLINFVASFTGYFVGFHIYRFLRSGMWIILQRVLENTSQRVEPLVLLESVGGGGGGGGGGDPNIPCDSSSAPMDNPEGRPGDKTCS